MGLSVLAEDLISNMNYEKFKRYNAIALSTVYSEPEEGNFHTDLIPKMVDTFFKPLQLPKESLILDIGCGGGTFTTALDKLGYNTVVGITKSKEDFEACRAKGYIAFDSDMSDLPFDSDRVDFIWCRHALEHSPFPLFTLLEFNRVLRLNSKMFIEVPAPDCHRKHEFNSNHYSILSLEMWHALFQKSGFTALDSRDLTFELVIQGKDVTEKVLCIVLQKTFTP